MNSDEMTAATAQATDLRATRDDINRQIEELKHQARAVTTDLNVIEADLAANAPTPKGVVTRMKIVK